MLATEKAGARPGHHATALLAEADRLMTVCNSCRYCEGLCAVFPAMEMRRAFPDGDLNYLANLCHGCGACYVDCQFSPPHEFDVNVPRVLAQVRNEFYAAYAWPRVLAPAIRPQRAGDQHRGALERRGVHPRLCGLARPIRAVRHAHRARRVLQTDAACRDGVAVRARVPLRDRRDGARPACLLARYRRSGGARWPARSGRRSAMPATLRYLDGGGDRLLQPRRTAERPAPVLSSPDILRLRALLRVDLRGDALSLPARPHRAVSVVGSAGGARHGRRHRADLRPARFDDREAQARSDHGRRAAARHGLRVSGDAVSDEPDRSPAARTARHAGDADAAGIASRRRVRAVHHMPYGSSCMASIVLPRWCATPRSIAPS